MYQGNVVILVASGVTKWAAHERAQKFMIKGNDQFQLPLFNNWKDAEALGLIMLHTKPKIIATVLMWLDVFTCTAPLNLTLPKEKSLSFGNLSGQVNKTITKLNEIKQAAKQMRVE